MSSNENQFDPKFMMEALMNEMKRMMRGEMDQIHKRLNQIEFNQVDQPRNTTNGHQRRKVQPREDRTENVEFNREGFDEDDDRNPSQRRYGGQFGEA